MSWTNEKNLRHATPPIPLWKNQWYCLLWLGYAVSGLGDRLYAFILPWLLYDLTGSALSMNAMRVAEVVPNILLGLVAGVLVDSWGRRKTIVVCSGIQCFLIGVVALLGLSGLLKLPFLYVGGFMANCAGFFVAVSFWSLIPCLVDKAQLTSANASISVLDNALSLVGPAVAGVTVATIGLYGGLGCDALSFMAMTIAAAFIRISEPIAFRARSSLFAANREAFIWLRGCRPLLLLTIMIACINLCQSGLTNLMIVRVRSSFQIAPVDLGFVLSAGGVASLLAGGGAIPASRSFGGRRAFALGFVMLLFGTTSLVYASSLGHFAVGYAIDCAGITIVNISYAVARQSWTPNTMLGRVTSLTSSLMRLSQVVALFAWGFVGDTFSPRVAFGCMAIGLAIAWMALWIPIARHGEAGYADK